MPTGNELLMDPYSTVLVGGPSGSGKTSLIAHALKQPTMCPIYVFDFDLRLSSLLAVTLPDKLAMLSYDQYRDTASLPGSAFTAAEAKLRALTDMFIKQPHDAPKTIVLDSLTFCQRVVMNRVLVMDGKPATSNPELQHYKSLMNTVEPFISRLTALPCNIIVTAHDDPVTDKATNMSYIGIDMTGQLATRLPGYFNEVWHAELASGARPIDPMTYRLRTRSSNIHRCRTCFPAYLDMLEDATQVWAKIEKAHQDAVAKVLKILV